ncbi:hypothetical protein RHDC4_01084 [Rhodocyclaceae bacterium]|nr:hypothetical protein RHDC4_01084 [Rhodocyclaceae bacterium]
MQEKTNKNLLIDLGIAAALILIGVGGYWYSPLLLPKSDVVATPPPGCNLHREACSAVLPEGGRIELSISPRPIPMVAPLTVEVRLDKLEARKVEVDFAGIDMNMGYNRPELPRVGPGHHAGTASLPVCITGTMAWSVTVLVETDRQRISVPFRFDSEPH